MNFQEKMFETTAELRGRAAKRVESLKSSLAALTVAGRKLNKVARRHAARFVKENSALAVDAGKDVSSLARSTYATLAKRAPSTRTTPKQTTRKAPSARKRTASKAV